MTERDLMQFTRRRTLQLLALGTLQAFVATAAPAAPPANSDELRVIAYNIYKGTGYPKSDPLAKEQAKSGELFDRIADELKVWQPDVITISESTSEPMIQRLAERLGYRYQFIPSGEKWPGALLTRLEIVDFQNAPVPDELKSAELFTRHWGRAVLRRKNGDEIIVHSAHLHPRMTDVREREIQAMLASMQPDIAAGKSLLVMGDLNHRPVPPEYSLWTEAGWTDTFAKVGKGKGFTVTADDLSRRIDYVLANGPIADRLTQAKPLAKPPFVVSPTGDFALSDHLPQFAAFSDQ